MTARVGRKKTTIYDVAAAVDASVSTVSLVLNGDWSRYRIKEETSERILKTARELGYKVNLRARGLRLSKSGLAGMILPHYRNRFFADLAETFELGVRKRNLCPIVVSTQRDVEVELKVASTLLAQRVEFLFIAGVADPAALNRMCDEASVPCVNVDLPGTGAPSVVSDNRAGALLVTQKLIDKVRATGKSANDMLFLGGVAGEYATDNRIAGFLEALRQAGVDPRSDMVSCCGYRPENSSSAFRAYVERHGKLPSGLFISSITTFEGVVRYSVSTATALDCAVGCFDWDPFAADLPFTVAMLRQDVESMMEIAFNSLTTERQLARDILLVPPILERA
ncbi:MAG: LacI family DNA-binding transcriptional regulator [Ancalomicrobiaceae bacterium]|nr:LacI family DNA-binding transcriptional regulator [Ancalomicrobiaceae bacterium]